MSTLQYAWDPDLGAVEVVPFPTQDVKRWVKAENQGMWYAYPEDGAPEYHEVFMLCLNGRYRYVSRGGIQYGPELRHLVEAVYFAFGHGWLDSTATSSQNVRCQMEMRCNSRLRERDPSGELAAGAFDPDEHGPTTRPRTTTPPAGAASSHEDIRARQVALVAGES